MSACCWSYAASTLSGGVCDGALQRSGSRGAGMMMGDVSQSSRESTGRSMLRDGFGSGRLGVTHVFGMWSCLNGESDVQWLSTGTAIFVSPRVL